MTKREREQQNTKIFSAQTHKIETQKMTEKYKGEVETFAKNADENIAELKLKRIKDSDIMVSLMEDSMDIKITVVGEGKFVRKIFMNFFI